MNKGQTMQQEHNISQQRTLLRLEAHGCENFIVASCATHTIK
jgi:hypothetical protein